MSKSMIRHLTETILCGMTLKVTTINGTVTIIPKTLEKEDRITYGYECSDGISGTIDAIRDEKSVRLEIDLKSDAAFVPEAAEIPFNIEWAEEAVINYHDNPWWMIAGFPKKNNEIPERTQNFLFRKGDTHFSIVLLLGDIFHCDANQKGLHLQIGCGGYHELHGAILTLSVADRPVKAVETNYQAAVNNASVQVPLRKDRAYPAVFEKFGWCSWDTFYTEITSEKIYKKLDEFKEKRIPIKWVILDCGWSTVKDERLMAFEADPEKFPEGLAACILKMKTEYGIEKVGVWHTFQSYWQGVHPDSPLADQFASSLIHTLKGERHPTSDPKERRILPCNDPKKAFAFWDAWHSYMKSCGVDFVKVDNQSSACDYFDGTIPPTWIARNTHIALEQSLFKHFGGDVINCMGMDMINALQRPVTAITRNSDDFFPNKENGFFKHLSQNVYNAIWHSQLHHCDFDMWWSGISAPVQSGVLRAISGGPVYVSDKQDISSLENILPVVGESGDICRMDDAALPTDDCIYKDCEKEKKLLTVYNKKADAVALAAFNVCKEDLTEEFSLNSIPVIDTLKDYVLYEYFTRETKVVKAGKPLRLTVSANDVKSYSLYPIHGEGEEAYFEEGDTTRYVSCSVRTGRKVLISEIQQ